MPDSDESCRIIRPASHTSALGLVFIAENGAGAQGGICGDENPGMKALETTVHPERTAKALTQRAAQDDKHFEGGHRRSSNPGFLMEPRPRFYR